jgi:hypothetical protein
VGAEDDYNELETAWTAYWGWREARGCKKAEEEGKESVFIRPMQFLYGPK